MKRRKRKPISQAEQSRRFIEAAEEAGVEADADALKRMVREIAKASPKPPSRPKSKK